MKKQQHKSPDTILRGLSRAARLVAAMIVGFTFSLRLSAQNINVDNSRINVGSGAYINTDGSIHIQNSGAIDNSGAVQIKGDWTNDANGLVNASPGTVEFNGTAVQALGGTTTTTFNNLVVNNSNGITLSGNIVVNGTLTFTSGKINTGSFYVILGSAATVSGAGTGKYVNGNMRRFIPATASLSTTFCIGDASNYTPVTLDFAGTPSGSGSIDAATVTGTPAVASGISQTQYVNRQWNLTNNGVSGFTSYSPTFNFVAGDLVGSPVTSTMVVRKLDVSTWSATTNGAQNATNTQCTGVTAMGTPSTFAIGNISAPSVSCPANILASNSTGLCANSSVSFAATSSSVPAPVITYSQNPGTSFPVGTTNVIVTATNINGSTNCNFDVTVQDTQFPTITAPADVNVCFGSPVVLGTPTANDNCSVSISNTGALVSYPVGTTVITWIATDPAGHQTTANQNVVVSASPVGSASNVIICDGSPANIALSSNIGGTSFTWNSSVTTGTVTGATNCASGCGTTITNTLSNNGNPVHGVVTYTVTPTYATCSGSTFTVTATVGALPATPVISGLQVVCFVGATTYTIPTVAEATSYTWAVPSGMTITSGQNSTSITVNVAAGTILGQVTVYASNDCGDGGTATLDVSKVPFTPTITSGPATLCGLVGTLSAATYTCSTSQGATGYTWTVPTGTTIASGQGTTSIVINYNTSFVTGNVTVKATNSCSNSPLTTLVVTGNVPAAPVAISGVPSNVCGLSSINVSVAAVAGASSYNWSVTGAGNSVVGSGTTATVTLGGTTGVLTCKAVSACGEGLPRTANLVVTSPVPASISGPANLCGLTSATYTTPNLGAVIASYNWAIVVTGWTITSGQGTSSITITGPLSNINSAAGSIKVSTTNICGSTSAQKTLSITRCADPIAMNNGVESSATFSNIYPNPASTVFTIDVTTEKAQVVTVEVYDILGNLVISEKHNVVSGTSTMNTNIEQSNDGMYFVRLLDADSNIIHSGTVIKQ